MVLKVEKISTKSQDFKQIKRVYEEVFPKVERIPLWLLKMRANEGKAEFCSLYDENEWVPINATAIEIPSTLLGLIF